LGEEPTEDSRSSDEIFADIGAIFAPTEASDDAAKPDEETLEDLIEPVFEDTETSEKPVTEDT